jgi:hypothetical protein
MANCVLFLSAAFWAEWARRNSPPSEPWQAVSKNLTEKLGKDFLQSLLTDLIKS